MTEVTPTKRTPNIFDAPDIRLPNIIIGVDAETKSTRADAYVVAVGAAAYDVATMRMIACHYQTIDPNDEKAKALFHEDPYTMAWWRGEGDNPDYAPSREAFTEAFSGTMKMPDALWGLHNFFEKFKTHKVALSMRGPEFDQPILMNAYAQCDVPQGLLKRFSMLDSDRTAERIMHAFNLTPDYRAESHNWTRGKDAFLHHAGFDSAREGYITARIYHLAMIARLHGFDRMLEAHNQMMTGEYTAVDYLREE